MATEQLPKMDWEQVTLNGGPPCFSSVLADGSRSGWYCGRAERWSGHGVLHEFVSLDDLLSQPQQGRTSQAIERKGKMRTLPLCESCSGAQAKGEPYGPAFCGKPDCLYPNVNGVPIENQNETQGSVSIPSSGLDKDSSVSLADLERIEALCDEVRPLLKERDYQILASFAVDAYPQLRLLVAELRRRMEEKL